MGTRSLRGRKCCRRRGRTRHSAAARQRGPGRLAARGWPPHLGAMVHQAEHLQLEQPLRQDCGVTARWCAPMWSPRHTRWPTSAPGWPGPAAQSAHRRTGACWRVQRGAWLCTESFAVKGEMRRRRALWLPVFPPKPFHTVHTSQALL